MVNILITSAGSTPAITLVKNLMFDSRVNKVILADVKAKFDCPTYWLFNPRTGNMRFHGQTADMSYYNVPLSTHEDYPKVISEICDKENIDLVIPTMPNDITTLYHCIPFPNLMVTAQSLTFCNKLDTAKAFEKNNILQPNFYLKNFNLYSDIHSLPLIAKPFAETAGIGQIIIRDYEQLSIFTYDKGFDSYLVQEYFDKHNGEFTTDIVCDQRGKILGQCTRQRIATRNGLCMIAETVSIPELEEEIKKICSTFHFYGQINIQSILKDGKFYFIEINPRPAGSAAISYQAGMPIAQMIIDAYLDEKCEYPYPKAGIRMLRYWDEVYV